jgi:integrase
VASQRIKTKYVGVYYREAPRIGGKGMEKVYYVTFKMGGKTIEEKAGRQYADDMTPARAATYRSDRIEGRRKSRKELREEAEAARLAEAGRWTLAKLWEEYKSQRPRTKAVASDDSRFQKHIAPLLGDKEPCELLTLDIDRLRLKLLKNLSPQTVKHIMALIRRIIAFGLRKGLCAPPDPQKLHIEIPRVDNEKTEDLNPDELQRLLKAINEDENQIVANLMRMALYTGMRRGELFKLQWRDVNLERNYLTIRGPKGGKSQDIPLNDAARSLLQDMPREQSPYVFPNTRGHMLTDVSRAVNRIKERAGLPQDFRPLHGLRHVYASMLASSGKVDMYTLQKLMTHKSPVMTQRYAHLRDEAMRRASDVAGDILNEAMNGKEEESGVKVVNLRPKE